MTRFTTLIAISLLTSINCIDAAAAARAGARIFAHRTPSLGCSTKNTKFTKKANEVPQTKVDIELALNETNKNICNLKTEVSALELAYRVMYQSNETRTRSLSVQSRKLEALLKTISESLEIVADVRQEPPADLQ